MLFKQKGQHDFLQNIESYSAKEEDYGTTNKVMSYPWLLGYIKSNLALLGTAVLRHDKGHAPKFNKSNYIIIHIILHIQTKFMQIQKFTEIQKFKVHSNFKIHTKFKVHPMFKVHKFNTLSLEGAEIKYLPLTLGRCRSRSQHNKTCICLKSPMPLLTPIGC